MSQTPQHILDIIQEAKEKRAKTLNLSGQQLTEIPPEVFELTWLEKLDLSRNQLTSIPESVTRLQNLTTLHLSSNKLTSIPESVTRLKNLTTLDLMSNKLTSLPESVTRLQDLTQLDLMSNKLISLPESITRLQNLIGLDLSYNELTLLPKSIMRLQNLTQLNLIENKLTSLPESIGRLKSLNSLDLRDNKLTSLPESAKRLQNLTRLYLNNNKLISLPAPLYELHSLQECWLGNRFVAEGRGNQIKEISAKILQLTNLTELDLEGNPIESPPPEVVFKGVHAIKNYFRQLQAEGTDYIYEAKLLIVGEGGAGKTSLAKKLENPAYQLDPNQPSTHGIDVIRWYFPIEKARHFQVNVWDFGGQEIYHATHQFFLTKRSLYALVCDTRKEDTDFYYWLNVVRLLSDESPLLIIKNEKQERQRAIPQGQLRAQFTNLKGTLATNLATNRGLDEIKVQFAHYLRELPHIGDKLPKTWVKVRQALEQMPENHISLERYLALCRQHGFQQDKDALQLSAYLHDLGVILHFQDERTSLLYKTVILKANWGTDAVYRVLDNKKVIANLGEFTQEDLVEFWHEPKYANMLGELLELMLKFQLCYEVEKSKLYIAPQLLSQEEPHYKWNEENNLILRYHCPDFMPKGIISRFIVLMHDLIEKQEHVWRSGVILKKDNTRAEVIEYFGQRQLKIRISGPHKRDLMTLISNQLDKLFGSFKRLNYQKLIPCNCPTCKGSQKPHAYPFNILRKFAIAAQLIQCQNSFQMVNPHQLIDDVSNKKPAEAWPPYRPSHAPQNAAPSKSQLRQQLKTTFDDVQFDALCLDHFEEIFDQFAAGMQRDAKINLLLLHCRRQPNGLQTLHHLIKTYQ